MAMKMLLNKVDFFQPKILQSVISIAHQLECVYVRDSLPLKLDSPGLGLTFFLKLFIVHNTVKPRYTGPTSNGNPPITNAKPRSLQAISF